MAENTFLGLQPYTEDDAYRFKGRTEESQELFRLIVRNDFTVCYAESGEGKTSLLNAGVFPLLRENMYFPIAITFTIDDYQVTPDNFSTIIDRCIKDSITEYNEKNKGINVEYRLCSTDFQGLDCQIELQQELSKYSWWKLRNYKPQAMGLTFTPVFVFDQFEEVFNMPGSIVWTKKFFDWLEDVYSDSCPDEIAKKIRTIIGTNAAFPSIKEEKDFKAVFSLRKEFIGELDYWGMQKCFIPSLKDNRYCLKALTYEGAKKVMTQQERFDESKVEQVLTHFVKQHSREPEKAIKEHLPIIPALMLSIVCDGWEKDIDTFAQLSTAEIGQSLTTVLESFFNQAIDTIVQELSKQLPNTNPSQCRYDLDTSVFALVDGNGKRVRTKTTNAALVQINFDARYKQALSSQRIIKITKVDGEDYVEIVHDCLCPIVAKQKEERHTREAKEREKQILKEKIKRNRRIWSNVFLSFVVCCIIGIVFYQKYQADTFSWKMMENQARFLAKMSMQLSKEGDSYLARLLAINVLPSEINNPNMPYKPEAECALRYALMKDNAVLNGHTDGVCSVSFNPDGTKIVSASFDYTIRIWDAKTGKQIGEPLIGHEYIIYSATFNHDGTKIVSAGRDGTIRIWDAKTGKQIGEPLIGHTNDVNYASFNPDGTQIVSASNDGTIRIWDAKTGKQIRKPLVGHTSDVNHASFNPDGTQIVSASNDRTLRIWDANTGKQIGKTLEGHTDFIVSASFSPDGKRIVSAGWDMTIRIWDAITGEQIGEPLKGHTDIVYSVSFNHDGTKVASASADESIKIWKVKTNEMFKENSSYVKSISFNYDDKKIVSAGGDTTIRIWDAITGKQIGMPIKGHESLIHTVDFGPDGTEVVSASDDCSIRIWDTRTGVQIGKPMLEHTRTVNSAFFSHDGLKIVSASDDHSIKIWDAQTHKVIRTLSGHEDFVLYATFNFDGTKIVSASDDCTIRIWDVKTGKEIVSPLTGHESGVNSASFNHDGTKIISTSYDNTIRIWDVRTGKQIGEPFIEYESKIIYASFNHDGTKMVSALANGVVKIWDLKTMSQIGQLQTEHAGRINNISVSNDGTKIVSASFDGSIRIWDYRPLQELIDETRERFKERQLTDEERQMYYLED